MSQATVLYEQTSVPYEGPPDEPMNPVSYLDHRRLVDAVASAGYILVAKSLQEPDVAQVTDLAKVRITEESLCAQTDPEVHFPEKGGTTRPAKQTCLLCPARAQCLGQALMANQRDGVWGALSDRERQIVRKVLLK